MITAYLITRGFKFPVRREFENVDAALVLKKFREAKPLDIEHSFPDWLFALGEKEFAAE